MDSSFRLSEGGQINREKTLSFQFNGKKLSGFDGDTLASALLANGIHLVGRSFKYHRPRGIFASGLEEPNAIVQLELGKRSLPNHQATQIKLYDGLMAFSVNCWPNPSIDVMAINNFFHRLIPAGFYYKTFMWPKGGWKFYEYFIRRAAGLGHCPKEPDPDLYDQTNIHTDILIIGGGPSGLAAAIQASSSGARVVIADDKANLGGRLLSETTEINNKPGLEWVEETETALKSNSNLTLLKNTVGFGYYDHNLVCLLETRAPNVSGIDGQIRQRLWKVRAKHVILAQGAFERPLVFSDNDRPGIMLAGAVRTYINQYAVAPGSQAVVFTNNDDAYRTALVLHARGVKVISVIDIRKDVTGELPMKAVTAGIEIIEEAAITRVIGTRRVKQVEVMLLNDSGDSVKGSKILIECDLVCVSGGWNPAVHLHSHSGGKNSWRNEDGVFIPDENLQGRTSTGSGKGFFLLEDCLSDGWKAGQDAVKKAGFNAKKLKPPQNTKKIKEQAWRNLWYIPSDSPIGENGKHFVDQQHDVTAADIHLAVREGYSSVEHAKRYTTLGMATDQGKTSNIPGHAILAATTGQDIPSTGTTTFRPPFTPITIGAFAGRKTGHLFAPIRRTPIHQWHENNNCIWEDVGDWKRPWYYLQHSETMNEALARECLAARKAVGILDASTLGKIDIQGRDAAKFLDLVYTNSWSNLGVGCCRYGIMLSEDGMIMDDGVTSRLGENHYLMTTTTGNASRVLSWLEEWSQTEWPSLDVFFTSVTEQFATITLSGPNARALLSEFTKDINLSKRNFPFMHWREGIVGDLPARVFRISFSGECSFEINVPASGGMNLWTNLINAGEKYGIVPYGTETMHILRAEKGYIIVGQETDGTVTPTDLGMDWILSRKKDFIGKRSLSRPSINQSNRKQLVGLMPHNSDENVPEGGQIVSRLEKTPPMQMIGHVTSSYHSATLGRSFALALIQAGRKKLGQTVYVPLEDRIIECEVTSPFFYDKVGNRLND